MPLGPDVEHINKYKLTICRHLQYAHNSTNALVRAVRCRLIHEDNRYCFNCSKVEHCPLYPTKFLVKHQVTKSAIYVLV